MLNLHPDYGLPDSVRQDALATARRYGVRDAARAHGLHPSTLWRWRKLEQEAGAQAVVFSVNPDAAPHHGSKSYLIAVQPRPAKQRRLVGFAYRRAPRLWVALIGLPNGLTQTLGARRLATLRRTVTAIWNGQ